LETKGADVEEQKEGFRDDGCEFPVFNGITGAIFVRSRMYYGMRQNSENVCEESEPSRNSQVENPTQQLALSSPNTYSDAPVHSTAQ
jgi:hypothetical protein